ncbi:hypothetical protein ATO12_22415 [Aquimarina atlantica]|uniref:Uncharacterized protein n=1 Tax=Aquimarina atlantica TaxID=1317122 RepID=A0A023BSB8_9FLAO|nr:hypothetical protein [Aquimarina atlantica]EZH72885.1 hypothetical protein ATO12_22415 [Aquimarina atlantica]
MKLNEHLFLVIDSKRNDYQSIHIGILQDFVIACKFKFHSETAFEITHGKIILINKGETPEEYHLEKSIGTQITHGKPTVPGKIELEILTNPLKDPNTQYSSPKQSTYVKKTGAILKPENIIDITIPNTFSITRKNGEKETIVIDLGNHICKFYVI